MKRLFAVILALLCFAAVPVMAATPTLSGPVVNETGIAYSKDYDIDLNALDVNSLSVQVVYSSVTTPAVSFYDGVKSTGTITVSSNTALSGKRLLIGPYALTEGIQWTMTDTSTGTAKSIADAINAMTGLKSAIVASWTAGSSVVYTTATACGTAYNYSLICTTPSYYNGRKSTGTVTIADNTALTGRVLRIGTYTLTEGVEWTKTSTSSGTAKSIADAINAKTTLKSEISASWATDATVVNLTALGWGPVYNYTMTSSTPAALVVVGMTGGISPTIVNSTTTATALVVAGMTGGVNPTMDYSANTISASNHALTTALPALYTVVSGTSPTNLVPNTTYYAIPVDMNTFKLASTSAGAIAGTAIDIVVANGPGNSTLRVTPVPLSGNATFYFMYSNDGTNFVQHPTASSGTVTAATTANSTFLFDFGSINWRYLRIRYLKPVWGAVRLAVTGNGKK
jgi:hypothetical protein